MNNQNHKMWIYLSYLFLRIVHKHYIHIFVTRKALNSGFLNYLYYGLYRACLLCLLAFDHYQGHRCKKNKVVLAFRKQPNTMCRLRYSKRGRAELFPKDVFAIPVHLLFERRASTALTHFWGLRRCSAQIKPQPAIYYPFPTRSATQRAFDQNVPFFVTVPPG